MVLVDGIDVKEYRQEALPDKEIFIFDDSTSALDLKTEADLYQALKKLHPDRTKIIIAQRIASVRTADRRSDIQC